MAKKRVGPRMVQCYLCRRRFEVGAKAMTVSCPGCHKPLLVQDVVVKTLQAVKRLQTCGRITVQKKGRIIAELVEAHEGLDVRGVVQAKVVCGALVRLGPTARWRGDCHAPVVKIESGATIESGVFTVPDHSLDLADLHESNDASGAGKTTQTMRIAPGAR